MPTPDPRPLKRLFPILLCALIAAFASPGRSVGGTSSPERDPTAGVLPAYNDAYANWAKAGLQSVGGIPNRTTVCATLSPMGGTASDATQINTAIASCPLGQVVQLGPGVFLMNEDEWILLNRSVTLRGAGACTGSGEPACPTLIKVQNGAVLYRPGGGCGADPYGPGTPCKGRATILMAPAQWSLAWAKCNPYETASCPRAVKLDADAAAGATTVRLRAISPFRIGQWVLIDEASGATWQTDPDDENAQIWAASDALNPSGAPKRGNVIWQKHRPAIQADDFRPDDYPMKSNTGGCYWSFCDRPTAEMHKIVGAGAGPCPGPNCTLTFDSPLTTAFRKSGSLSFSGAIRGTVLTTEGDSCALGVAQIVDGPGVANGTYVTAVDACAGGVGRYTVSVTQMIPSEPMTGIAHQALVYPPSATPVSEAGVENLSIARTLGGGVAMDLCVSCWVRNVEAYHWHGGGINIRYSARAQIEGVYIHDCGDSENNGQEYGIDIQNASTEIYVVNSISVLCGKPMTARGGGAGSVIAYNLLDQTYYLSYIGNAWIETVVNGSHSATPHDMLFEGNQGANLESDNTHGASQYQVYFRNWGPGYRTPFTDPSTRTFVDDLNSGRARPLRAAGPMAYSYWFAFVGNMLGTPGHSTAANGWKMLSATGPSIWMSGWQNWTYINDPNLGMDPGAFIFRHGNYDTLSAAQSFAPGYAQALPGSFYPSAQPAFFSAGACAYPWPWVTPESGTQIQSNSCGGPGLPARARLDAGTPFIQP